jgi:3-methylcrotonyl-CoA carboxylase alpha subunit
LALKLTLDGTTHEIQIVRRKPVLQLRVDGRLVDVPDIPVAGAGRRRLMVGASACDLTIAGSPEQVFVRRAGRTHVVKSVDVMADALGGASGANDIVAPMPGTVVSVEVAEGGTVTRNQPVITIESMKLQTTLCADRDGVVAEILKQPGEQFDKDEVIARLARQDEKA